MLNLFAYRSTDPAALYQVGDPVGDENDRWILESIESCEYVIAAWGKHGQFKNRAEQVSRLLNRPIHCLAINGDGSPRHPLYIKGDAALQIFGRG